MRILYKYPHYFTIKTSVHQQAILWYTVSMDKTYENDHRYFENSECRYYPCHDLDHINCLFCYCPLYQYENCPGDHMFIEKDGRRIKNCTNCTFPHQKDNYDSIIRFLTGKNG